MKGDYMSQKEKVKENVFMSREDLSDYNKLLDPEPKDPNVPSPNIILSENFRRPVRQKVWMGSSNVILLGGAGSGKTCLIKENILQMNASYIVTDPLGMVLKSVGKTLTDHGYKIRILNLINLKHSHKYNPLNYVKEEGEVRGLVDCILSNTPSINVTIEDEFFLNAERLLLSACIFYLMDFCQDESKKDFKSLLNMIKATYKDDSAKYPLDELFVPLPQDSLAWKYYESFKQAAGKTLKKIVLSCTARLETFVTPEFIDFSNTDEMDLANLEKEKAAIFIVTPCVPDKYQFLGSLIYTQTFDTLIRKDEYWAPNENYEGRRVPLRCFMDEFSNVGYIPDFVTKYCTMHKFGVSMTISFQSISQIETIFSKDRAWKTILAACCCVVYLGLGDPDTINYLSETFGVITTRHKNGRIKERYVVTTEELYRLGWDQCIVFPYGHHPLLDKKYKYESHPHYKETGDFDPTNNYVFEA